MDVSIRKLRYFLVLAEELHFTRAAGRLFIAQQSLSKQIQELEAQLGIVLFHRTRHSVVLTDSGVVLFARLRPALADLDGAIEAARRSGEQPDQRLRIGFGMFAALELTSVVLAEFTRRRPDVEVELHEYPLTDQSAGLLDDATDVSFVRPPLASSGLSFEILFTEPRVLSISGEHALAACDEIGVDDVLDLRLSVGMSDDEAYQKFWSLEQYRTTPGAPPVRTSTNTEELQLIASGLTATINPAAVARYLPHPGVACVPIRDITGSSVALAWPTDHATPLVREFVECARRVRDRETDLVARIEDPFVDEAGGRSVIVRVIPHGHEDGPDRSSEPTVRSNLSTPL